ncbi:TRAP transporter substrate-binding protein DctP [Cohnella massiliensis]|uniref:TRAP transporter substrate-binding protein DctP n=1 Tax=Cohnella massiliensis TaxID=1816691 RepID=UPI0009BA6567|nr:TRAP transporter substrate-binding protein DctP [Cohnella massiliensis]
MNIKFKTGIALALCAGLLAACSSNANTGAEAPAADAGTGGAAAQSITVNAVSFLAKDDPLTATIHEWIEMVDEATGGEVKINWRGGADIIPPGEQANAVQTGAIDLIFNHTGQYESQNREVSAIPLSRLTPWEERENGFFDAMAEAHRKIDMVYLGRWLNTSPRIWLNEPVTTLAELNGKKIRATGNYTRFFESLGINSVIIDPGEVYTSLQTGVVEGFVYGGLQGPRQNGWTDSSKYVLDHPFWNQNVTIVMNPAKWDSISAENQQKILDATAEYERYMVEYYDAESEKERAALEEAGVTFIQLSEEEGQAFVDRAFDVEWEYLATEIPDQVENLRSLSE